MTLCSTSALQLKCLKVIHTKLYTDILLLGNAKLHKSDEVLDFINILYKVSLSACELEKKRKKKTAALWCILETLY